MRITRALRAWWDTPVLKVSADPSDVESVTVRYLMYVLVPAWFVPGVADWLMHRRSGIERTSGLRESLIHSLMMGEITVPVTLVLLCEVNPALLALAASSGVIHTGTALWDGYAATAGRREVTPLEQRIHSFLESIPFMAISALTCLHWDRVTDPADRFAPPRLRQRRLPAGYLAAVGAGVTALIAVPYAEELLRCARARKRAGARERGGDQQRDRGRAVEQS